LHRDGQTCWSQGENYLALQNGQVSMDVYPRFFDAGGCSACMLHRLSAPGGGREHAVRVFYPAGYAENQLERFPVVYMQDGQNLFFPNEAFGGHDWMIDQTLNVLDSMNLVRRAIVVGVYPTDRMVDYTQDGYDSFGRFLVDAVRPWVDANYRTLQGPEHTAVMGSSLGGVVSLYLAWQWPQVFGYAGCLSSTFGYRDDLASRVSNEPKRPIKVYLDSGWPRDNYEVTRNMRNRLVERGFVEGRDLMYLAFPHARHDEPSWAMRAHIPFQHFFGV
jgi:predicted alpha/beta superfamily hydrolase